jgi:hypothetical protein
MPFGLGATRFSCARTGRNYTSLPPSPCLIRGGRVSGSTFTTTTGGCRCSRTGLSSERRSDGGGASLRSSKPT